MRLPGAFLVLMLVSVLSASTGLAQTISSPPGGSSSSVQQAGLFFPYYSYQPIVMDVYQGPGAEYPAAPGQYPLEDRFMVWTADGKYSGLLSPVWTGEGKGLYGLNSVWTGDGENVPTVSHVWTGDGKELTRLDSWVEGYF